MREEESLERQSAEAIKALVNDVNTYGLAAVKEVWQRYIESCRRVNTKALARDALDAEECIDFELFISGTDELFQEHCVAFLDKLEQSLIDGFSRGIVTASRTQET